MLTREVQHFARLYYSALGNPLAKRLERAASEQEWAVVASATVDPNCYRDAASYFTDAAAVALLKKHPKLPSGVDRRAAAMDKWKEGERQCFATNERLIGFLPMLQSGAEDSRLLAFIEQVKKHVRSLIGGAPPNLLNGRFGPGATFLNTSRRSTLPDKMSGGISMTRDALWFLPQFLSTAWFASGGMPEVVPGNRFTTVPKTALTDRAIAVEPSMNVFFQLALGTCIRDRLYRKGIDLLAGQDAHRAIAQRASVGKHLATIDLSNASDTVAKVLVKLLLPPPWFSQLDDLRSKRSRLPNGGWVFLEKFSSMGNGYTFELETTIFLAICLAVYEQRGIRAKLGENLLVYGDDIIVVDEVYSDVCVALKFFGFTPNAEKSFGGQSNFRESCGGDFFNGSPVRGYYLKSDLSEPLEIISALNQVRRVSADLGVDMSGPVEYLTSLLPLSCRLYGPAGHGDSVIHDSDRSKWVIKVKHGIRWLRTVQYGAPSHLHLSRWDSDAQLATALYLLSIPRGRVMPRQDPKGYRFGWTSIS